MIFNKYELKQASVFSLFSSYGTSSINISENGLDIFIIYYKNIFKYFVFKYIYFDFFVDLPDILELGAGELWSIGELCASGVC